MSPADSPDATFVDKPKVLEEVETLYSQFLDTHEASTLDKAIALAEGASLRIPGLEPILSQLRHSRLELISAPSTGEDDTNSVKRKLTQALPDDDTEGDLHGISTSMLKKRYEDFSEVEDVDTAISLAKERVATTPVGHPDRPAVLNRLSGYLISRYERLGNVHDLDMAIQNIKEAVAAAQKNHPNRPAILNNLGNFVGHRYQRFGDLEDLNESIERRQEAVEATALSHPDRPIILSNLSTSLSSRFKLLGNLEDLQKAIAIAEEAITTAPEGYPHRGTILTVLGGHLCERYQRLGVLEDLEKAIERSDQAVKETPAGNSQLAARLNNLGNHLGYRYQRLGSLEDLKNAIEQSKYAVEITPESHPDRASRLGNLGCRLNDKYQRLGDLEDLEKAIRYSTKAIEATPYEDPREAGRLADLAKYLGFRYERLGSMEDLEMAIGLDKEAIEATPKSHSDLAVRLSNLGCHLCDRFQRLGNSKDIEEGIERIMQAVNATPVDSPYRAAMLGNLSRYLHDRYCIEGVLKDLDKSIEWGEKAVEALPVNHPDRASWLSNLGNYVGDRYERLEEPRDIERAIEWGRSAVAATPEDSPGYAEILNNLSRQLRTRYHRMESPKDLDEAIELSKQAHETIPVDHYLSATMKNNLADAFYWRYNQTKGLHDLETAIELNEGVLKEISPENVLHGVTLQRLGSLLALREPTTAEGTSHALDVNLRAWNCRLLPPRLRVSAAETAATIYHLLGMVRESCKLYEDAVRLLPQISPRRLARDDQNFQLIGFSSLSSAATAMALQAGLEAAHALRLLELGRGITTGLVIDCRSSFSELEKEHPDIYSRFNMLRTRLDSPIDYGRSYAISPSIDQYKLTEQDPTQQRRRDIEEFEKLLPSIRSLSGFEGFLQPPPAESLMKIANEGSIIIVNCTSLRSDAILVTGSAIKVLPLPKLIFSEVCGRVEQLNRSFTRGKIRTYPSRNAGTEELLLWLWDVAVEPIFEALQLPPINDDSNLPRVWWIGANALATVPFHAAGDHSPGSTRNTLCRAISSYTPTIKALSYAREKQITFLTANSRLLLVAMPETPKHSTLRSAREEVSTISSLVRKGTTSDILDRPSAAEVLEQLSCCHAIHFTCHGISNGKNPLGSHLVLCKDRSPEPNSGTIDKLTVEAISSVKAKTAQIAYLSACSTARNDFYSLADESIHISSAFQLSGFTHVLATLWESGDKASLQVSCDFYRSLFDTGHTRSNNINIGNGGDHRNISMAFHKAVKRLRDSSWRQPLLWACFIHTGA